MTFLTNKAYVKVYIQDIQQIATTYADPSNQIHHQHTSHPPADPWLLCPSTPHSAGSSVPYKTPQPTINSIPAASPKHKNANSNNRKRGRKGWGGGMYLLRRSSIFWRFILPNSNKPRKPQTNPLPRRTFPQRSLIPWTQTQIRT